MFSFLPYLPLTVMLLWAAVTDIRTRRIRNWLTLSLLLTGFLQSFLPLHTVVPASAALGMLVGFGLQFPLFAIGARGAGDVKLLAAIGAWTGPWAIFSIFIVEGILGMLIVLVQASLSGRVTLLVRNSAIVALNLWHFNDVGLDHVTATGQSCRSIDRPLPFAVPACAATLLVTYLSVKGVS